MINIHPPKTKDEIIRDLEKRILALEGKVVLLQDENKKLKGPKASVSTSLENLSLRRKIKAIQKIVGNNENVNIPWMDVR